MPLPDVFTTRQAGLAGVTRSHLAHLVRAGGCVRVCRGAFVSAAALEAVAGDDARRHHLLLRARLLVTPDTTVAGHWSAVAAFGLPMLGRYPAVPILTRDVGSGASHDRFLKVATLPVQERTVVRGIRSTGLARTVVDVSRGASLRAGLVVADSALRWGLDPAVLRATADRWKHWPHGTRPCAVAALADGRAESPLETLGRLALHEQGVEPPELQVEVYIGSRFVARVDHLWERYRCIGEADGLSKYDAPEVLRDEKRRQETLEDLGFVVVRYDWNEAYRTPALLAERFRRGFARGLRTELDPRVRLVRTVVRTTAAA